MSKNYRPSDEVPRHRVLVADVDGTLLDSQGNISDETIDAARCFRQSGGRIILATGKLYRAVEHIVKLLSLQLPQIVCDGAAIADPNTGLTTPKAYLSLDDVKAICKMLTQKGVEHVVYTSTEIFARRDKISRPNWLELQLIGEPSPRLLRIPEKLPDRDPLLKVLAFVDDFGRDKELETLSLRENRSVRIVRTSPRFLEFSSINSGKLVALRDLSHLCNFGLYEVAGIGDSDSDADMISSVGLGGAVANGSQRAKASAKVIVASNDENGFVEFVREILGYSE